MLNTLNKERVIYFYNEFLLKMLADKDRKSIFRQLRELVTLTLDVGYWPHNYFKYDGYKTNVNFKDIKLYVPGLLFSQFRREFLNDIRYAAFSDDKFLFHKAMNEAGIPTSKLIDVLSYNKFTKLVTSLNGACSENVLNSIKSETIVIKPVIDSQQGAGVSVITVHVGKVDKFEMNDEFYTAKQLLDKLFSETSCSYLIEEKITQHSFNDQFYSKSVNTIRVDTLLSQSGEVIVNSAYLRIGRNGRKVDNWSGKLGGVGVNIDIASGQLSSFGVDYSKNVYERHPNTNVSFSGLTVPFWNDILALVKKAALELPNLKSLGWDVVLTEHGPILLEVNRDYDVLAQQTCTQAFGKNNKFYNEIRNYAKETKYARHFLNVD